MADLFSLAVEVTRSEVVRLLRSMALTSADLLEKLAQRCEHPAYRAVVAEEFAKEILPQFYALAAAVGDQLLVGALAGYYKAKENPALLEEPEPMEVEHVGA